MFGWLEDNLPGKVLSAVCGVLIVLMLLIAAVWSRPPHGAEGGAGDDERPLTIDVPELAPTAPIERFAVITERPVFNESRQPEIIADSGDQEQGEAWSDVTVEAPDVSLAGVVITPSLRVATLKPKDSPDSLIALEGQPLEGNYGSWRVASVEPRSVLLRSGDGEEVRLDLEVHDTVIAEPPKPAPREAGSGATAEAGGNEPVSRAEEIRQRIAERREELRRAAEQQQQPENEDDDSSSAPPDYRSAIQQMIQGRRAETDDENEQ